MRNKTRNKIILYTYTHTHTHTHTQNGEGVKHLECSHTTSRDVKWPHHFTKQIEISFKVKYIPTRQVDSKALIRRGKNSL